MLIRARETLPLDTSTGPVKLELIGATLNFRTEIEHCNPWERSRAMPRTRDTSRTRVSHTRRIFS